MKVFLLMAVAIALVIAQVSPVLAEESRYSLASVQGDKQIEVIPGDEGQGVVYFYNIDGNRITHISLTISQAPEGMEVEIQPASHEVEVTVNDVPVTVTENLHVEPSSALAEPPASVPEGMVCINVPTRGYVLACPAYIVVKVPSSAQIGTTVELRLTAEAEWLGQGGASAMKQERDFDFSITVVSESGEHTETINGKGTSYTGWWIAATAGSVVVLLGVVLTWRLIARKKRA